MAITNQDIGKRFLLRVDMGYVSEYIVKEISPSGIYVKLVIPNDDLGIWMPINDVEVVEELGIEFKVTK